MKFLVDTDIFIDFFRGYGKAVEFVQRSAEQIVLSPIVIAELFAGARPAEIDDLDNFSNIFTLIPITAEIARAGGLLKAEYAKSHGIGLADAILAATAIQYGLMIKTLNVKHYPMFPELEPAYKFYTKKYLSGGTPHEK